MILDAENINTVVLIGQSMGGYISQSVIKRYPERVAAFIAIDSSPYGEEYYSKSDKWWLKQIGWMSSLYPLSGLRKSIAKGVTVTKFAFDNMKEMLEEYDKKELCNLMGVSYLAF